MAQGEPGKKDKNSISERPGKGGQIGSKKGKGIRKANQSKKTKKRNRRRRRRRKKNENKIVGSKHSKKNNGKQKSTGKNGRRKGKKRGSKKSGLTKPNKKKTRNRRKNRNKNRRRNKNRNRQGRNKNGKENKKGKNRNDGTKRNKNRRNRRKKIIDKINQKRKKIKNKSTETDENDDKGFDRLRKRTRNKCTNRNATATGKCLARAVSILNTMMGPVANFEKQKRRLLKQNKTRGSKGGKKGLFKPIIDRIVGIGGGNKSKMECAGNSTNKGALQLANLTATLEKCEENINKSCSTKPNVNVTKMDMCVAKLKTFTENVTKCKDLAAKEDAKACECFEDKKLAALESEVKKCSLKTESDSIAKILSTCKKSFGMCRKYEDETVSAFSACSKDTNKLRQEAKNIGQNIEEIEKANATINTLLASRRSSKIKRAPLKDCGTVITEATRMIVMIGQHPSSPKIRTIAITIYESKTVTCSADDKKKLKEKQTSLTAAKEVLATVLDVVLTDILTQTGEKPRPEDAAELPVTEEVTTVKPSRFRDIRSQILRFQ